MTMNYFYPTRTSSTGLPFGRYYKEHNVYHPGVDFNYGRGDQDKGQPVTCPTWGIVEYVSARGFNGGLGMYLVIYHPWEGVWTRYLHLDSVSVKIGQKVSPKQQIATLGDTGTTSAHLHFEVLNYDGLRYIKNFHRRYGRYPQGMPLKQMRSLWLDPVAWLDSLPKKAAKDTEDLRRRLANARKTILRAKGSRKLRLQRAIQYLLSRLGL